MARIFIECSDTLKDDLKTYVRRTSAKKDKDITQTDIVTWLVRSFLLSDDLQKQFEKDIGHETTN